MIYILIALAFLSGLLSGILIGWTRVLSERIGHHEYIDQIREELEELTYQVQRNGN